MPQVLDAVLSVVALNPGVTIGLPHGLLSPAGSGLIPHTILPDRASPIRVVSADSTSVFFHNDGTAPESAFFWVHYSHSIQGFPAATNYWQGAPINSFKLSTLQWDDLRVPVTSTVAYGARTPAFSRLTGAVGAGVGYAIATNATNSIVAAGGDFGDFTAAFSIVIWFDTAYVAAQLRHLVWKKNCIDIAVTNQTIRVTLSGQPTITTVANYLANASNFLVVTVTPNGANTDVVIYLNGVAVTTHTNANTLAIDNANVFYLGATDTGAGNLAATLDEFRIYQATLTAAQVLELFNAGAGTTNEPTGSPTLLAGYHFDEGSGGSADNYQGNASYDISMSNTAWVAGLIGADLTTGIFAYVFPPGEDTELFFTAQMPHGWKLETAIEPHIHWLPDNGDGGNVLWGIEYSVVSVGAVLPASVQLEAAAAAGATPLMSKYTDLGSIAMVGQGLSCQLDCRVYRRGSNVADTATTVGGCLLEIDFHYQIDTLGSMAELSKF
jgi:hypothetical protein